MSSPTPLGFHYTAFGLILHSNLELPGIPSLPSSNQLIDVELHLGVPPYSGRDIPSFSKQLTYTSPHILDSGEPALRMWRIVPDNSVHIRYYDGTEFWLDENRKTVWATWIESSSLENALSYFFGPILGVLLRLCGVICLHASAVALRDHAIAFVGSEGAGKSTTAAAFARNGCAVISDDIVALNEQGSDFLVTPAYPHLSLWPESVDALFGSPHVLPQFTQEWDKRRLPLGSDDTSFERRTLPLGAVYLLGPRTHGAVAGVENVRPQAAHLSLVTNAYGSNILTNELRAAEFALIGRLVSKVPVRQLVRKDDPSELGLLCDLVRTDFYNLIDN